MYDRFEKDYKELLMNSVSWVTLRWYLKMSEIFPRKTTTKVSQGKTTHIPDTIIYRT